jgi:hypothetical protein
VLRCIDPGPARLLGEDAEGALKSNMPERGFRRYGPLRSRKPASSLRTAPVRNWLMSTSKKSRGADRRPNCSPATRRANLSEYRQAAGALGSKCAIQYSLATNQTVLACPPERRWSPTNRSMFEITAEDIAGLNDEDLRSLIALLCEAEMRRLGYPTSSVTWGGDQNAPDGGVDVRVDLPKRMTVQGFVPRVATGFQVKKSDMTPSEISGEMRPHGKVRSVIRDLATRSGAYIIVSSKGSVTDSALRRRREAMSAAVKGIKNRGLFALDFYDRGRVATWLRDHPGLIPWVRQKLGKTVRGWRSYGAWANPAERESAPYLLDDTLRIRTGKKTAGSVSAAEGLNRIRGALREARKVVRIVGLSGVGKTRLVQALFDGRVGEGSIDPSLAIYTNLGDDPDPQPVVLASDLIASKTRAILVIDNCPPDLHRRLSEVCRSTESLLSVVTVEYDIRDDDPEETDVFHLAPSSKGLMDKLLKERFKNLSQIDRGTIAKFSGGNAKVAIALAGTIAKNETVAGITDDELFGRLFRQRHEDDASLLLIAQACSLAYSFQGEAITGEDAELPVFAEMIGSTVDEVFRGVAELRGRELVQQRSVWRAVLPHAIANRLAKMALRNIPAERIQTVLINGASARLLKSFSRRLGYLHDSEPAIRLVDSWLAPGGILSDLANLNALGLAMFENIAPVAPDAVLAALERVPPETLTHREAFKRIIWSIAFEPELFERCAELLLRIGVTEQSDHRIESDRYFTSLFFIAFSGTHASVEQRIKVLEGLLRSDESYRRMVGIKALRNILEARHFGSGFEFEFGARPRDYGFYPKTEAELKHWYVSALKLVEVLARSDHPVAGAVRSAFASQCPIRHHFRHRYADCHVCFADTSVGMSRFWTVRRPSVRNVSDPTSAATCPPADGGRDSSNHDRRETLICH